MTNVSWTMAQAAVWRMLGAWFVLVHAKCVFQPDTPGEESQSRDRVHRVIEYIALTVGRAVGTLQGRMNRFFYFRCPA